MALSDDYAAPLAELLSNEVPAVAHEDLVKTIVQGINEDDTLQAINEAADTFIKNVEKYEKEAQLSSKEFSAKLAVTKLEFLRNEIYNSFFILQNLINAYTGRIIVMTYVHIDDSGRREIRISENNLDHIQNLKVRGRNQLKYVVEDHYKKLKQTIPSDGESNEGALQAAVHAVDQRYDKYSYKGGVHLVLWYPGEWNGALLRTKGPINEAFVNCFVHNIKLLNSLEEDIDTVMTNKTYGAIAADATKGFMIGDISRGGVQYAVKGAFGSPQGFKDVYNYIKKIRENDIITKEGLQDIVNHYTTEEEKKEYKPQIKILTKESLKRGLRGLDSIEQVSKSQAKHIKLDFE